MRDRYVRLKKVDPSNCHLREGEKWNAYFKRMRFLDPYIEHRQGKNQEQRYSHNDLKPYNSLTASHSEADETPAEAPDGIVDDEFDEEEPLFHPNPELLTVKEGSKEAENGICAEPSPTSYGEEQQLNHEPSASSSTSRMETTPVRKESQASTMETRSARKRPREEDPTQRALRIAEMLLEQREKDETEVSLYIRSIAKTLEQMDPRAFALARVRISQILYDCQFESNGV